MKIKKTIHNTTIVVIISISIIILSVIDILYTKVSVCTLPKYMVSNEENITYTQDVKVRVCRKVPFQIK